MKRTLVDIALDRDPDANQLEMFPEHNRNQLLEFLEFVWKNQDEIERMNQIADKVLAGEPKYARPEFVRKLKKRRHKKS